MTMALREQGMGQESYQRLLLEYAQARGYRDTSPRNLPVRVTITLCQPYAGYDLPHLDGLLQAAVVLDALEGRSLPASGTPYVIPLPLTVAWRSPEGIPLYASSSMFPDPHHQKSVFYWVKRNDELVSRFAERKRDGTPWQPDSGSGVFKEYRMPLPLITTRHFTGYAVGDPE